MALVAATLFALQSEALPAGLPIAGKQPIWMRVGSERRERGGLDHHWVMERSGRSIEKLRERRWFPIKPRALDRAKQC